LALTAPASVPAQYPFLIDGLVAGSFYLVDAPEDFAFLDYTTMALPYHLLQSSRVLVAQDPGSAQTGLALYHGAGDVVVLSASSVVNQLKVLGAHSYFGYPYTAPAVTTRTATLRGYLQPENTPYSLIVLPTVGTDTGGLSALQPEPTITSETLDRCWHSLAENGVVSVSTHAHFPPRESLRLLNMLIALIRENGEDPQTRIAVIRSWSSVTLVACKKPLTTAQHAAIRTFCATRGFDLVWLPGLQPQDINIHHQVEFPLYHQGARKLMGSERASFLRNYLYDLTVVDDNRPFFNRFGRWQGGAVLQQQVGKRGRAYSELGSFLLVTALFQTIAIAFILIPVPLVPVIGLPGRRPEQIATLLFFTALGLGFMFLEMALLQRLTVYLAHPLWAAATVLSGVLFFGGIGSSLSGRFTCQLDQRHVQMAALLISTGVFLVLFIDPVLAATEMFEIRVRVATALVLIAPLAILMGMLFPMGIQRLSIKHPHLIPWAWAVNGFASVLATLLTPLLAVQWGFLMVYISGLCCYLIAAVSSLGLPSIVNYEGS
jgi:DNA-binding HxlR family transcriptional regulator